MPEEVEFNGERLKKVIENFGGCNKQFFLEGGIPDHRPGWHVCSVRHFWTPLILCNKMLMCYFECVCSSSCIMYCLRNFVLRVIPKVSFHWRLWCCFVFLVLVLK